MEGVIRSIAEQQLISPPSDEVLSALAPDVEYRVREIVQEALKFSRHSRREVLATHDVNSALRLRNTEALYGFGSVSTSDPLRYVRAGSSELYYLEDRTMDLNEVLNEPLPMRPRDVTFSLHWLAIEGVQPATPQNPNVAASEALLRRRKLATGERPVYIKPAVKHVVSQELQTYYDKVTAAIKDCDPTLQPAALTSISNDPGLHQLLPYFSQFVADEVIHNITKLPVLTALMQMVKAMCQSPHLFLEPYLHQLIVPVLTCIVGRDLCASPASDDHWSLRDFAAREVLAHICAQWSDVYALLQPRVAKTLLMTLMDPTKSLASHYGAVRGLAALGLLVVEVLLIPNTVSYLRLLRPLLTSSDASTAADARRVYGALSDVCVEFLEALAGDLASIDAPSVQGSASKRPARSSSSAAPAISPVYTARPPAPPSSLADMASTQTPVQTPVAVQVLSITKADAIPLARQLCDAFDAEHVRHRLPADVCALLRLV